MKKKNTIPTILGIIVLLLGSLAGVFLINSAQIFKIGADVSAKVKNIRVANISDNSATISWTTDKETSGYVIWGNSEGNIDKIVNEDVGTQKYFSHSVSLTGLAPETKYFYKINSDGTVFDNSGIPWQIVTGPTLSSNKNSFLVSGNVINASGQAEKKALVYIDIAGYLFSTESSETGNYVFQIGGARTNDLRSYTSIDGTQTLLQLSVQAGDGVASAQIFPGSANPVPAIVIGSTYDFRNLPANSQGNSPNASLSLPNDSPEGSKFNVTVPDQSQKPTSIILESLSEGEVITSQEPQFFGKGPEGTTLTITVHSETPINGIVQIPKNGSWSYAVPTNLEPGPHTITISWIDVSGITRFLTRNFVVKAGEVPAFTASDSGNITTPTPSLIPSGSPLATLKPNATPFRSPTPLASASAMPVPVTGDLTPSLILFMMGLAVVVFSFVVWKVAES
jgi:hypothetical protein